jgi:hypothetical protein
MKPMTNYSRILLHKSFIPTNRPYQSKTNAHLPVRQSSQHFSLKSKVTTVTTITTVRSILISLHILTVIM